MKTPQWQRIVNYLKEHPDGVTTAQLIGAGLYCAKYTSRISDARKHGHNIAAFKIPGATAQWRYFYIVGASPGAIEAQMKRAEIMTDILKPGAPSRKVPQKETELEWIHGRKWSLAEVL